MAQKRALFIAYTFPPVGGAGVQRTTKFVKYLPEVGWQSTVLTVSNPSVPLRDDSLCRDVPAFTRIVRARTFEPSYAAKAALTARSSHSGGRAAVRRSVRRAVLGLMQPDPQMLWNGPALIAGLRALRATPHDVIIASAPPFSSLLLGAALARRTSVPLVLDYRDEWDVSNKHWENRQLNGPSASIQRAMERWALRAARSVIATSPRSAAALEKSCREVGNPAAVTCIFNGFDPDDFDVAARTVSQPPPDTCRLVYTGTLYNLMSPEPLVAAIEALAASRPQLAGRLELVFAGRHAPEQRTRMSRVEHLCRFRSLEYVAHSDAIALMQSASALVLLLSDVPGADRIIPAKLFEYVASRKPILAVAPRGDVWDLLGADAAASLCEPRDVDGICAWLANAIEGRAALNVRAPLDTARFDRRHLTRQLASLFDDVISSRVPGSASEEVRCSA